jgi:hypothetical protein
MMRAIEIGNQFLHTFKAASFKQVLIIMDVGRDLIRGALSGEMKSL